MRVNFSILLDWYWFW